MHADGPAGYPDWWQAAWGWILVVGLIVAVVGWATIAVIRAAQRRRHPSTAP